MAWIDTILKAAAAAATTAAKTASNKKTTSGTTTKSTAPAGFGGSATGVNTYTNNQDAIKAQMNQNSQAWHTATTQAEKDRLHAENERLSGLLGGNVSYNGATGQWSGSSELQQPSFDYGSYSDSKPTFSSNYSTRIDDMLDQILNRDKFSYDAETDPLYQQYKAQYNREGNRAMNDTLASVASNAGGMNSYAITAAQQANDYYASQVADKIPELYQLAYSMYLDDIDGQVRDLGLLQDMDNTQYNRYRDTMSDWRDDRDFAYGAYRDDMGDYQWNKNFDYGVSRDQVADSRYDQEWEYNIGRDQVADSRYENETAYDRAMQMIASGVMPNSDVLAQAGISGTEAQALYDAAKAAAVKTTSSGGGNDGKTEYGNDVVAVAALLGISEKQANALKEIGATSWKDAISELGIGGNGSGTAAYDTLKYSGLSERGKQIADLIDSDLTAEKDTDRILGMIEQLPDENEQNYLLRMMGY